MSVFLQAKEIQLNSELEELLKYFYQDLVRQNVSTMDAKHHVAQTSIFLLDYYAFHYLENYNGLRGKKIYDFIGLWYFQRMNPISLEELQSIMDSLQLFIQFLHASERLDYNTYLELLSACKDKAYATDRFNQMKQSGQLDIKNHWSRQDWQDLLVEAWREADRRVEESEPEDSSGLYLFEPKVDPTFLEMLDIWKHLLTPHPKIGNIILWRPVQEPGRNKEENFPLTLDTLKEDALRLLSRNLCFFRWLDRFQCSWENIPQTLLDFFVQTSAWLEMLLDTLDHRRLNEEELQKGQATLAAIEKTLLSAREQICHELGLDLELLLL